MTPATRRDESGTHHEIAFADGKTEAEEKGGAGLGFFAAWALCLANPRRASADPSRRDLDAVDEHPARSARPERSR
jgi:hypothetical protein